VADIAINTPVSNASLSLQRFLVLIHRITFVNPIYFNVFLKVEKFVTLKLHFIHQLKGRPDVGAMSKRTTPTVNNNI